MAYKALIEENIEAEIELIVPSKTKIFLHLMENIETIQTNWKSLRNTIDFIVLLHFKFLLFCYVYSGGNSLKCS